MANVAATFCKTLIDEWVRAGVTDAFIAPGSRSTPLALGLSDDLRIASHLFHDERAAGFAAVGHGLATGRPAIVLCTSGTAGAHLHGAVLEADLANVPLIVCTADRPPELWQVGAPQTVDQTRLYGSAVRFFLEPGVPAARMASAWRSMACQLVAEALGSSSRPGPVHANLSFVDPLVGTPGPLPPGREGGQPWLSDHRATPAVPSPGLVEQVVELVDGAEGVIVAGRGTSDPAAVGALAERLGWAVIADHRSGCRDGTAAVAHFDGLLRSESFAAEVKPEVVLRFGEPLASKVLGQWISAAGATVIVANGQGRLPDPDRVAAIAVPEAGFAAALMAALSSGEADGDRCDEPGTLASRWAEAGTAAAAAISEVLAAADGPTEPEIARAVIGGVPGGSAVVVASSMPVRDLEWFGPNRSDVAVYANRGANGIDGVIATAIGVALTGVPTTLLIGDVAFLHDSTSLIALRNRPVDLTIVVVDNDGGGIFSFLPQADELSEDRFDQLFGTPHGTDLAGLCEAHGIRAASWPPASFKPSGVRMVLAWTDRAANRAVHDQLNAAIGQAVETG